VYLAALFHDAGKLFSDMKIYPSDDKGQILSKMPWDPIIESLYDYCKKNAVGHYRVIFNKNRVHNAHNAFTTRFVNVMPPFPKDYPYSSQIMVLLDGILFGSNESYISSLHRLIKESDSRSVKMDFQRHSRPIQSDNLSVLIIDSIKTYLDYYPELSPVDTRAILIRSNLGVHIPYPTGFQEIINFARGEEQNLADHIRTRIPDVPKLVNILNESGYFQHYYYQTSARAPQVVRNIQFEFSGRVHNVKVLTLRPLEVVALLPTSKVVTARFNDEIANEYIKQSEEAMSLGASPQAPTNSPAPVQPDMTGFSDEPASEPDPVHNQVDSNQLDSLMNKNFDIPLDLTSSNTQPANNQSEQYQVVVPESQQPTQGDDASCKSTKSMETPASEPESTPTANRPMTSTTTTGNKAGHSETNNQVPQKGNPREDDQGEYMDDSYSYYLAHMDDGEYSAEVINTPPEQVSNNPGKDENKGSATTNQPTASSTNPDDNTTMQNDVVVPVDDRKGVECFNLSKRKMLPENWLDHPIVIDLHKELVQIEPLFVRQNEIMQAFIKELCICFSKDFIVKDFSHDDLKLIGGQLHFTVLFLRVLNDYSLLPTHANYASKINRFASGTRSLVKYQKGLGSNPSYYILTASITEYMLGAEYPELVERYG
jgi:hypothetical protein